MAPSTMRQDAIDITNRVPLRGPTLNRLVTATIEVVNRFIFIGGERAPIP